MRTNFIDVNARGTMRVLLISLGMFGLTAVSAWSQNSAHSNLQRTHDELKNPYSGQREAAKVGRKLFANKCARCHGHNAEGTANVPALAGEATQSIPEGVIFSYITRGDVDNGMPSWASLPEQQRWQIVTYLKSLGKPPNAQK